MGAEWNINVEKAADVSLTPVCEACGAVLSRGRHQNNCGKAAIEQAMDTTTRRLQLELLERAILRSGLQLVVAETTLMQMRRKHAARVAEWRRQQEGAVA